MKIKVLGCSGAEFPNFSPPAFLIDDKILLDAGTTTGSLNENAQRKINHILITHAHLDHIRGIPPLADNMFLRNRKHSITLVGIKEVLQTVRKNLFNNAVWPDFTRIPSHRKPVLKLKVIKTGENFKIHDYKIIAEKVNHSIAAIGYIIEDSNSKRLLYTGDTGTTANLWERANLKTGKVGIDGAIIEVTFPNNMKKEALRTGHLTPAMLLGELKKLEELPRKIFATHAKPQFLNIISKELRILKIKHLTILKERKTYVI
jgi:cAMP phosphodiesterase